LIEESTLNESETQMINKFTEFLKTNSNLMLTQFESPYKRQNFYEKELGFIKPEEVLLKTTVTIDDNDELIEKSSFGYYIPFEKTLTKLLHNLPQNIDLQNFNVNSKTNSSLNSDIFDGKYVKNILNATNLNSNYLSFIIYCDEMEVTNAIGSSRTKHKLSIILIRLYKNLSRNYIKISYVLLVSVKFTCERSFNLCNIKLLAVAK
jgi:hypothetical protein